MEGTLPVIPSTEPGRDHTLLETLLGKALTSAAITAGDSLWIFTAVHVLEADLKDWNIRPN